MTQYTCEKCYFTTNTKQLYDRHLLTGKHINGCITRTKKDIPPLSCTICNNYKTINTFNLQTHILNHHSSIEERGQKYPFYCNVCDFGVYSKASIDKHIKSNKHIKRNEEAFVNPFED